MSNELSPKSEIIHYQTEDGRTRIQLVFYSSKKISL